MAKKKTTASATPADTAAESTAVPAPRRRRTATPKAAAAAPSPEATAPSADVAPSRAVPSMEAKAPNGNGSVTPTYEQIAEAAYHRYLKRGGNDGRDFDDWVEAERELRGTR
jgi:hypothetical protein